MRGFKVVSKVALLIWLTAISSAAWFEPDKLLNRDATFLQQLAELDVVSEGRRILIYGSSGVLLGVSAEALELFTGHVARNLSTSGRGGQIESAIDLMKPHIRKGDLVVLGDRSFRLPQSESQISSDYKKKFQNLVNFLPRLIRIFDAPNRRSFYGDFIDYPQANFSAQKYDSKWIYSSANIDTMQMQIRAVKEAGGCPLLVLVPLLVKLEEKDFFEDATRKLIYQAGSAGLSENLLHTPAIETDRSLFVDQSHMSAKGRIKWTAAIGAEIFERNLCGLGRSSN